MRMILTFFVNKWPRSVGLTFMSHLSYSGGIVTEPIHFMPASSLMSTRSISLSRRLQWFGGKHGRHDVVIWIHGLFCTLVNFLSFEWYLQRSHLLGWHWYRTATYFTFFVTIGHTKKVGLKQVWNNECMADSHPDLLLGQSRRWQGHCKVCYWRRSE